MDFIEQHQLLRACTSDAELDKLEYAWNWPYDTLSLISRWNLLTLTLAMHQTFATDQWFWLFLDSALLDRMHKIYVLSDGNDRTFNPTELYPQPVGGVFMYHFVPTPVMRNCWDVRRYMGDDFVTLNPSQVQQHWYPFEAMVCEPVPLHVPPHFVICDTGAKLDRLLGGSYDPAGYAQLFADLGGPPAALGNSDLVLECLARMHAIYRAWMAVVLPDTWKGEHASPRRSRLCETDGGPTVEDEPPVEDKMVLPALRPIILPPYKPRSGTSTDSSWYKHVDADDTGTDDSEELRFTDEENRQFFDGVRMWVCVVARYGMPPEEAGPPEPEPEDEDAMEVDDPGIAGVENSWVAWALPDEETRSRKLKRKREP